MKKRILLCVIILLVLLFTACGKQSEDTKLVYYDGTYLTLENGAHAIHVFDGCCTYFNLEILAEDGVYPPVGTNISIQGTMGTYTNDKGITTPRIETERLIVH